MTIESQKSSLGPYWTFLVLTALQIEDNRHCQPFMACPALQAPIQESHDHLMAPKCRSRLTQGLRKAATEPDSWLWNKACNGIWWCIEPVIHFWWNRKFDIVCGSRVFQIRSQMCIAKVTNKVTIITIFLCMHIFTFTNFGGLSIDMGGYCYDKRTANYKCTIS